MPTLGLCLIVKNEEEVLDRCLKSFIGDGTIFDEVVVVDTGSADNTKQIAKKYGCKIYDFKWVQDFAAARNFAFSKVSTQWILWTDADDVLLEKDFLKLKIFKPSLTKDLYLLPYDYAQDERGQTLSTLYRERIVKNDPKLKWKYPIHECISLLPDISIEQIDITITHKRTNAGFSADLNRNIKMLELAIDKPEYKGDARLQYYLAKECYDAGLFERAARELEKFIAMNSGWIEDVICAQQKLAESYRCSGKPDLAKKAAFRAIEMDYRWAEPYYILASAAMDTQDWHQAIHWFEQCRRPIPPVLSPTRPDFYTWLPNLQLCVCYNAVGNIRLAYERNEEALKYKPNDARMLNNKKILHNALHAKKTPSKQHKKLNLGSGNKRYFDYTSCDKYPGKEVDEVFPLDEIPYADNTIQSIHSEHALEHLYREDARIALKEWYRVLVPGGDIHLQMPDLKQCCEKYIQAVNSGNERHAEWYRWTIYGAQISQGDEPMEGQIHYTGFSLEEIKKELEKIGFVLLHECCVNYDGYDTPSLEVRAVKPVSNIKVGWVSAGTPLEVPQYRIRTYHIDRWLRSKGYKSNIISCEQINNYDTLIFNTAFDEPSYNKILKANQLGKQVVINLCEDLFGFGNPWFLKSIKIADVVVCCSHNLAEKVKEINENVIVIEDAVESDFNLNCGHENKKLKAVFCGMGGHKVHAEKIKPIIEKLGYELITIHEHPDATIKWNVSTWQSELAKCDIGIAPCDFIQHSCKSNVKATQYMALGLPVVVSPLPAYLRFIKDGENGFIAETEQQWEESLRKLGDAELRRKIGQAGKQTARQYHIDVIGSKWRDLLIKSTKDTTTGPLVDIIIPTYDNPQYLEQCIESIKACTDVPHNVIVIDAKKEGTNFSASMNIGIKQGTAPYVCFLNDDTIVSKGWIKPLIEQIKDNIGFCDPLSNCDRGWLHNYDLSVNGLPLQPGIHKIGHINPQSIYDFKSPSNKIYTRDWVAFYATMTSREVINKVGLLDEEYKTGSEDLDYCLRANKLGYKCAVAESSFVFHFGGISRKRHEDEDPQKHIEEDRYNNNRIKLKYEKPLIVIHSGLAWSNWDARTLHTEGLGGSEVWAIRMSEEFSKLGYRVVCFGPMQDEIYNEVEWKNQDGWDKFINMNYIDICIISRYPQFLESPIRAGKRYLQVHDVHPMNDNGLTRKHIESGNLNAVMCLSSWHRDYVSQVCQIPKEKIILVKNGIDI